MDDGDNRSWADRYAAQGEEWADLECAAQLLEDLKSTVMAQRQASLGDMPVNRAEQMVKASPEWSDYIHSMVEARKLANLAKVKLEALRMGFTEEQGRQANERAEKRLTT